MEEKEIELMSHCLGIDLKSKKKLPKEFYRNYFCLQDLESFNKNEFREPYYTLLMNLQNKKYVDSFDKFGNKIFYVTQLGIQEFRKQFNPIK